MPRSGLGEAKQEKANIDQVWERGMTREGNYWSGFEKARPGYATIDQVWERHDPGKQL